MTGRLTGRVALITGAASGMGACHARAFVAEGAAVVVADIADEAGTRLVQELGERAVYMHLDVTRADDWAAAVATAVETFGHLDVLVNNAGLLDGGPLGTYTEKQWNRTLSVNLTGPFLGLTAARDALVAAGESSVINISSAAGIQGVAGMHAYTASKFGLRGLTKSAALELAPPRRTREFRPPRRHRHPHDRRTSRPDPTHRQIRKPPHPPGPPRRGQRPGRIPGKPGIELLHRRRIHSRRRTNGRIHDRLSSPTSPVPTAMVLDCSCVSVTTRTTVCRVRTWQPSASTSWLASGRRDPAEPRSVPSFRRAWQSR